MKKMNLSLVAILAMGTFAIAGGDIAPVEPVVEAAEVVVEEISTGAFYVGIGYSLMYSDVTNIRYGDGFQNFADDVSLDTGAVMFDLGYKFNEYVAVEARYWAGVSTDELKFSDYTVHGDILDTDSDAWGIYVKPMYPVTDAFDIYGLLGYGSASLDHAAFGKDVEGISWGVGAAYSFTNNISVFVDYVAFTEDSLTDNAVTNIVYDHDTAYDHSFDTVNFGLNYQF